MLLQFFIAFVGLDMVVIVQLKSNVDLIPSIFYVINFWHFLEMLELNFWHFWKMSEIHYIKNARN